MEFFNTRKYNGMFIKEIAPNDYRLAEYLNNDRGSIKRHLFIYKTSYRNKDEAYKALNKTMEKVG